MSEQGVYVHPQGLCESEHIGPGTRIWAFAHVLPGARIGADCNICDHVFIENDVVLGDRVTVKSGVQLWDGVRLKDGVFVGPNATFTNDRFPRSKQYPDQFLTTEIDIGASIGAGAVLLPGIKIGRDALVGAGAVVTHDVPPNAVVVGNPARIVRYTETTTPAQDLSVITLSDWQTDAERKVIPLLTQGCALHPLPTFQDLRGSLTVAEFDHQLPFPPRRQFLVYGVPSDRVRGEHAHKACAQFLVAVHGALSVVVDDSRQRQEVRLDRPTFGLLIPPGVWGIQYKFSRDAVLAVYATHAYDPADYIRDYGEFLAYVKD